MSYPRKNSSPSRARTAGLVASLTLTALALAACNRGGSDQVPKADEDSAKRPPLAAASAENRAHPLWTNFAINTSVHARMFKGGEVWVGTEAGLIRYDLTREVIVEKYDTKNGLLSNNVMALEEAPDGGLWVGTHGGGLTHISAAGKWTHHSVPDLGDPFVYQVLADVSGEGYWVATWSGLSHFDGEKWRTYTEADGLVDDWVYAMAQEKNGTLWLGTEGGVSVFDGATWTTHNHADGLGADAARIEGYEVIGNPSRHHRTTPGKTADGYNPNYVLAALIDAHGNKWFGTWGAGLSRFDGSSWVSYTKAEGLGGNYVTDLYADAEGVIWATTDGGVSVYRDGRWETYAQADGLIADSVFTVQVDKHGRKWFGTMSGISRLDGFTTTVAATGVESG